MSCRVAMLTSLLFVGTALEAFAGDADAEAIKRAIVMDSAMTREDFLKVAGAEKPPRPSDCEDQSLTLMLFASLASVDEDMHADFRPLKEGRLFPSDVVAEVARVRQHDNRWISYEPMTFIHLDRMTDCTYEVTGDTADGVVSFRVPGLYEGKAAFIAIRHEGEWFISRFTMRSLDIDIVREQRDVGDFQRPVSVWRQKPDTQ